MFLFATMVLPFAIKIRNVDEKAYFGRMLISRFYTRVRINVTTKQ